MCLPCQQRGQVERWKSPLYVNTACIKIDHSLLQNGVKHSQLPNTAGSPAGETVFDCSVVIATQPRVHDR